MADIVGVFNSHVDTLGWYFTYGNKENQNLLQSDMVTDAVYFLLDPVNRNPIPSKFGGVSVVEYTGSFLLVVKSDMDNTYGGDGVKVGKYELNIKPLLTKLELLKSSLQCDNYNVQAWSNTDIVNALDVNMDGLVVTYKVSKL